MLLAKAKQYLQQYFGYESFRNGQEEIITRVLSGYNTAGIMPTGGGKSICYQIPALILPGITLVISPLISLMKDQVDALEQVGISATYLNSSLSMKETRERMHDIQHGIYKMLYIAPERLESSAFLEQLKELPVSLVAVDEAHCISQWGHDFRPSYLRIRHLLTQFSKQPTVLALTATATPQVCEDICEALGIIPESAVVTGFARTNLSFKIVKGQNRLAYVKQYIETNKNEASIIYAATRKEVDHVYEFLQKQGICVGRYHAGMSDDERGRQQDLFLQDDITVMVATNAFGMGIDKSNVRSVLHYQLPKNMESYYQEAGRAGRDGLDSECILLFSPQDIQVQRYLIEQSHYEERKNQELHKLRQMKDYCYTEGCLQGFILQYFGENDPKPCGRCSNCVDERTSVDVTRDAQMVLSCMIRMGERFGKTIISQVLTGSSNKKVLELGFDKLTTYGIMKDRAAKDVADLIDFLTSEQYIGVTSGQYPVLFVSNEGKEVLLGKKQVLRKEQMQIVQASTDDTLFEMLRGLRKEIAAEEGVPPFVIFSDQTLRDMAAKLPQTTEEMLGVKGVGQQKQERYGKRFIAIIDRYVTENGVRPSSQRVVTKEKKEASHLVTYELYKQGYTLRDIAKERNLSLLTIENHILQCAEEGKEVQWEHFFSQEQEVVIREVIIERGGEKLKPLKEALPDDVSYFTIKAVLAKMRLNR
ncbi:DNA helicase RecQ [Ectobacillus antri]|uniref:DNA helicase RecQ n=1 Tax=Ectobacillus antri TaxID=2486280 RepID=A0ABT6H433_9BACI|nr:DNA helicase RecQ [Ectobacillus antri]MDG4657038.1 DNA helicase RecQ [Ectobacillus antri]MDG5754140.1 DNA helicase RecQ [Ectobacillus antri]